MEAPSSSFGLLDHYWSPTTSIPSPTPWTRHQDKIFEHALVMVPENSPNRWMKIAGLVPGKSAAEVRDHYDALVSDVQKIDSGRVELPNYADESLSSSPERESPCQLPEKATPTQVASHAQKYFLRQESAKKDRKRSSIHDITTVEGNLVTAVAAASQGQLSIFSLTHSPSPSFPLPLSHQFSPASYFPNQRSLLDY
ncbi:Protein RADIALIS-like 6, partial [Cucurbita argyrosperma subsp. argyrosperma]